MIKQWIQFKEKWIDPITWIILFLVLSGILRGQDVSVEIVPYRLVPSQDIHCQIQVELVEPVTMMAMPDVYKEEIKEILVDRVVFEETNPFALNHPFQIDDRYYQLIRIPNTGETWYQGPWNHSE